MTPDGPALDANIQTVPEHQTVTRMVTVMVLQQPRRVSATMVGWDENVTGTVCTVTNILLEVRTVPVIRAGLVPNVTSNVLTTAILLMESVSVISVGEVRSATSRDVQVIH